MLPVKAKDMECDWSEAAGSSGYNLTSIFGHDKALEQRLPIGNAPRVWTSLYSKPLPCSNIVWGLLWGQHDLEGWGALWRTDSWRFSADPHSLQLSSTSLFVERNMNGSYLCLMQLLLETFFSDFCFPGYFIAIQMWECENAVNKWESLINIILKLQKQRQKETV